MQYFDGAAVITDSYPESAAAAMNWFFSVQGAFYYEILPS
jgi:hypothetical protein